MTVFLIHGENTRTGVRWSNGYTTSQETADAVVAFLTNGNPDVNHGLSRYYSEPVLPAPKPFTGEEA